ncbi:MAG: mechanosensitive ion channel family protein [Actinobacteria bacterium]|nr:mechanosensitive ion channel family protein [Actinomycetota bacterium]MBV8957637.1 mechanosensitive ion channel family protein [Actinomycetota bacterium]MBV9255292.1 mechanosensitive ion channel family protein [Actinomycetota bacterium]MBV9663532.1 mechanosensitive ion channel family protein [Actinomycetota bacterium]MBV9935378.1 mechanosensitive ion channel family protein [Actinomycetota bacterium]
MPDHGYVYELGRKLGLSDFGARTVQFIVVRPLRIALILIAALVIGRLCARAVRRLLKGAQARAPIKISSPRAQQRADTIADVLAGLIKASIYVIAAFMALSELGVNLAPLIAGAGIAGIAVGFGAQSLVKDFISGMFILVEDQYGVGDQVDLNGATGTVEDVTLRVTRVRGVDGTVWYVPNGEIRKVGNASMEWSRAVIDVQIAPDQDITKAMDAIAAAANAVAEDPASADVILEPPEVWGVHAVDATGVTIRLVVKTAPKEQAALARMLRGRILDRLREEGIRGPAQTTPVVLPGPADTAADPSTPSS